MTDVYPTDWDEFNQSEAKELKRNAFDLRMRLIERVHELMGIALLEDIQARKGAQPNGDYNLYTQHHIQSEELAQTGLHFRPTLGMQLARYVDSKKQPTSFSDTIELLIPIDEGFDFNEDIQPSDFPRSNEVFIILRHNSQEGVVIKYFRISAEGVQEYDPISAESLEHEIELGIFIDTPEALEELSQVHTDAGTTIKLRETITNWKRSYQKIESLKPVKNI